MDVLYPDCAGIDVHKKRISVCLLSPGAGHKPQQQTRDFGTTTRELLDLADWLLQNQVTHVGMESTGVYWKPIWNILEAAGFTLTLANAQPVKNVPGKKTDTADCVWLAQLLRHGLLPASFVPAASRMFQMGFQYTPVLSMPTCVTWFWSSQSASSRSSRVVVPNSRTCWCGWPCVPGVSTQTEMVFLCTSMPAQEG